MRAVDNYPLMRWTSIENVIHEAGMCTRSCLLEVSLSHLLLITSFLLFNLRIYLETYLILNIFHLYFPLGVVSVDERKYWPNPTSWLITTRGQQWAFCLRDRSSLQGHSCIQTCINKSLVRVRRTETLSYQTVCSSTLFNRLYCAVNQ